MPIEWKALVESRRVEAVWTGRIAVDDWARFIDDMHGAGYVGYAKLHDLSLASIDINPAEIRELARKANEAADGGGEALGPVAFIIDSARALERVMQFDDGTATSLRPIAVFATRELALEWLDGMAAPP
jgi:hypothetical protein